MTIHVTREAAELIRRRGGRLFLWQRKVGGAWMRDCSSFDRPPPEVVFGSYHYPKRGVEICLALDLEPRELIVRGGRWPFRGVRIYVDGKRWGWRGEAGGSAG